MRWDGVWGYLQDTLETGEESCKRRMLGATPTGTTGTVKTAYETAGTANGAYCSFCSPRGGRLARDVAQLRRVEPLVPDLVELSTLVDADDLRRDLPNELLRVEELSVEVDVARRAGVELDSLVPGSNRRGGSMR